MKKCKNCKERFETRFSTLEKYCWNPECKTIEAMDKLSKLKKDQKKTEVRRIKKIKQDLKTSSDLKKELQTVFNHWVRLRDHDKGCISCGKPFNAKYDAGHYYSVGNYPSMRFDPLNCHGQCVHCNQYRGGNLIEYRAKLIDRIGVMEFVKLEDRRNIAKKYEKFEILELLDHYKSLVKLLKNH